MTFTFRPGVRENVSLLIGLAGASGSGKTYTAFRLASGIAGGKPFAVIDTEAGRAKHYADAFKFDHGDLAPPFRPQAYADAIHAADKAGYPVIVVDSMTHEWAGEGGVLDWQAEEYERLGGREATKLLSWAKPKQGHKAMVQKLLQIRAHLILCFRAEEKVDMIKEDGKTKIVPKEGPGGFKGWLPICEKNLPYELTASFLLMAERPGVPVPMKLQEQHRPLFPLNVPITEESGARIAEWARGGSAPAKAAPPAQRDEGVEYITADQVAELETLCQDHGIEPAKLRAAAKVDRLAMIRADGYQRAKGWIDAVLEARNKKAAA